MPLDPEVTKFLESVKGTKPRSEMTVEETRKAMRDARYLAIAPVPLAVAEDREYGAVPVRVYQAEDIDNLPTLVFAHGGRFISGDLETHDSLCRQLAKRSRARIVAVDYSLAPEHRFPSAVEDVYSVVEALYEESPRLAVGGDSAGGNLAISAALMARDHGENLLSAAILLYPMLDALASLESHKEFDIGYGPSSADMLRGWNEYAPEKIDRKHPYLSPLWASDLRGLPPVWILAAEYDTLRDEAEEFGRRLFFAGVHTEIVRAEGMIHGFLQQSAIINKANLYLDQIAAAIRLHLFDEPSHLLT